MVRQVEADMAVEDDTSHVANIGKMVEDMELKMRNLLQEVYFGKAKDVVGDLRSMCDVTFGHGGVANVTDRYSVAQPDEQGQGDAEGDDQQYGSVRGGVVCNECTRITNEEHQHGALTPSHPHLRLAYDVNTEIKAHDSLSNLSHICGQLRPRLGHCLSTTFARRSTVPS
jgi:hypothetical protein